jgi:hypothetical protein
MKVERCLTCRQIDGRWWVHHGHVGIGVDPSDRGTELLGVIESATIDHDSIGALDQGASLIIVKRAM